MYYKLRCNSTQFVIYYKLRNYYKLQRNMALANIKEAKLLQKEIKGAQSKTLLRDVRNPKGELDLYYVDTNSSK